jgi:uncharacterized protein with beta-barrel porin domain
MQAPALAARQIGPIIALSVAAAALFAASPAAAACDQTGPSVSCTGTTTAYDAGIQGGITVTVQPGATVLGTGGTAAITLTNPSGVVGNTLINNGTIDGFVTILSSGFLIDSFFNNGVLRVTDPLSPLQSHSLFVARFFQSTGATFFARADANGFNDNIFAGQATLAGRLAIVVQPGLYTAPITYTFVSSNFVPIAGAFDSVTASSPFFTLSLSNVADVTLTPIAFNAVAGLTPNQQHVADVLQNLYAAGTPSGDAATFYSNLFAAASVSVFDQLSGAGTSASQNASFGAAGLFNDAMGQQGIGWLGETPNATSAPPLRYAPDRVSEAAGTAFAAVRPSQAPQTAKWRAWGLGFGSTRSMSGQSGLADQSMQTGGGAIGFERVSDDLLIGLAAGGSSSHFSVSSLATSGTVDGGHFGVYAASRTGALYATAALNYARFDNSIDRTIAGVGPTENAHGRFASDHIGGRLELGVRSMFGQYTLAPFAAIEPAVLWQHAYAESSTTVAGAPGILQLNYAAHRTTSFPTFLGAQIDTNYLLPNGHSLRSFLRAAWVNEFSPERRIESNIVAIPGAGFTVDGARPSRDAARIGAGTTWTIDDRKALFMKFSGDFSRNSGSLAGMAGAKIAW